MDGNVGSNPTQGLGGDVGSNPTQGTKLCAVRPLPNCHTTEGGREGGGSTINKMWLA